jgi:putative flavoprotein involved in K+ transport
VLPSKADDFPSCSGNTVVEKIDTVVVGGGQAGLAMSYHLKRLGREHIVIERGRVAESWRSERWDSLMFQFPNSSIQLPGYAYETDDPNGYVPKDKIVRFLENYATVIRAPLRCGFRVNALRQNSASGRLLVETEQGSSFEAVNVVVATGPFHLPQIPTFANSMPVELFQVHSRDYRNPGQLPPGAVLVVGTGASGSQIAEELHHAGRKVYLSTGRFHKTPRRYRGRDVYWWFEALGIWHRPLELQPEVKGKSHLCLIKRPIHCRTCVRAPPGPMPLLPTRDLPRRRQSRPWTRQDYRDSTSLCGTHFGYPRARPRISSPR